MHHSILWLLSSSSWRTNHRMNANERPWAQSRIFHLIWRIGGRAPNGREARAMVFLFALGGRLLPSSRFPHSMYRVPRKCFSEVAWFRDLATSGRTGEVTQPRTSLVEELCKLMGPTNRMKALKAWPWCSDMAGYNAKWDPNTWRSRLRAVL